MSLLKLLSKLVNQGLCPGLFECIGKPSYDLSDLLETLTTIEYCYLAGMLGIHRALRVFLSV